MKTNWQPLKLWILGLVALVTLGVACGTTAASPAPNLPQASAATIELWVDPVAGSDDNTGTTRDDALATVSAAWAMIPRATPLTGDGYRILLLPGDYADSTFPHYWEERYGTAAAPIEIVAAEGAGSVRLLGYVNIFDVDHLLLKDLRVENEGDVFHCEQCTHLMLQGLTLDGGDRQAHETVKINQSQYITITHSDIFGSYENAIDFVAVQYGAITDNRLHDADDWCIYLKGGSAYFRIERNVIYNCGTGGFTAGQGTGFEFMTPPWLHYEAYDIKFVNNVIHDTWGAGMGVNGGYNILLAHNTLYRVGERSHIIEVVFGLRGCDGDTAACQARLDQGGWGTAVSGEEPIPNRNIYIYNNLIYNPPGYASQWQHFAIHAPRTPSAGSNVPSPARTDENLQIRGNWIWNGPTEHPLGIGDGEGCLESNPTCNRAQLVADNSINGAEPAFVDVAAENFRLVAMTPPFAPVAIPNFDAWDVSAPAGVAANEVGEDFAGNRRTSQNLVGAYAGNEEGEEQEEEEEPQSQFLFLPTLANLD
jgi:hypothetical protein